MTRSDLSYATHQLAKFTPEPAHWKVVKKVLQYLWRAKTWGLFTEVKQEETPSYQRG